MTTETQLTLKGAVGYTIRTLGEGICTVVGWRDATEGHDTIDVEFTLEGVSGSHVMSVWIEDGCLQGEW